jgi:hypothetical protein
MACSVLGWLSASARAASYLRHYGTVLIIIALPLLVLGAHALDLTDSAEKREKEFSRDRRDE